MKILHVCINGKVFCESFAYQENLITKAHRKLGHDVTIITSNYYDIDKKSGKIITGPVGEKNMEDGIKLIRLKPVFPMRINQSVHCFYGLKNAVKKENPDLLFVHGVVSLNLRFLKKYKKCHPQIQIVYDNHADFKNSCSNKLSYAYHRYVVRNLIVPGLIGTSNHFYGVVPARCDFLHDMYGIPLSKISLLPMGAFDEDMQLEKKEAIRNEVRKQYGITPNDFLIVTGGRIEPRKNIHVLAEAVKRSGFKNIKMLIFGSIKDEMKEIFEKLESDRIQCIGWQPSNRVYRFFYAADVVMFPGLHSVLWEQAVASQVPCAFSKIKGFEHVDIGGNCILMEGKSVDYYQPLIEKLYNDKDYYKDLCEKARNEKSKQFLYSHIAQKVIEDINEK